MWGEGKGGGVVSVVGGVGFFFEAEDGIGGAGRCGGVGDVYRGQGLPEVLRLSRSRGQSPEHVVLRQNAAASVATVLAAPQKATARRVAAMRDMGVREV